MDFIVNCLLRRKRLSFSEPFYRLHRARICALLRHQFGCLTVACALIVMGCFPVFLGGGSILVAAFAAAIALFLLLIVTAGIIDEMDVRVLPYFERELGGTNTWLSGRDLLWNSAQLDAIAASAGRIPLSRFVSGDPLIYSETGTLFDTDDALATVKTLVEHNSVTCLGTKVVADLKKLRDALALAQEQGVKFSLHVREGNTVSGYEMDQRRGSYF